MATWLPESIVMSVVQICMSIIVPTAAFTAEILAWKTLQWYGSLMDLLIIKDCGDLTHPNAPSSLECSLKICMELSTRSTSFPDLSCRNENSQYARYSKNCLGLLYDWSLTCASDSPLTVKIVRWDMQNHLHGHDIGMVHGILLIIMQAILCCRCIYTSMQVKSQRITHSRDTNRFSLPLILFDIIQTKRV